MDNDYKIDVLINRRIFNINKYTEYNTTVTLVNLTVLDCSYCPYRPLLISISTIFAVHHIY